MHGSSKGMEGCWMEGRRREGCREISQNRQRSRREGKEGCRVGRGGRETPRP